MKKDESESLPSCALTCRHSGTNCAEKECRYWIDYTDEHNCSLISIEENGSMTLEETSKRMDISIVRVFQIQKAAMAKIKKQLT